MLLGELSNVMLHPNATVHFPNVPSHTIPQRLTNVLLEKNPNQDYDYVFPQYPNNDNNIMQCNVIQMYNLSIFFSS